MSEFRMPLPEDLVRIGDLARRTGVPVATLRYYETEGLIQCVRTRSKYRLFTEDTADTIKHILHLKSLKIPLGEIRQIILGNSGKTTTEDYQKLQERLAHILEQKSVWEEQERRVRLMLASFPPEVTSAIEDKDDEPDV